MSVLAKQLIDYRREGFMAVRVTALAGLVIGCLFFIL
jgi:hypothetical protein